MGLSIGEHDSPKIAVLEIHYDNYESKAGNFRMRTICHWVRQFQAPSSHGAFVEHFNFFFFFFFGGGGEGNLANVPGRGYNISAIPTVKLRKNCKLNAQPMGQGQTSACLIDDG